MELVAPKLKSKRRRGRGLGSGRGKTCGRGTKGQNSRAGKKSSLGFEGGQMPIYRRVPKRGFTNIFKVRYQIVNILNIDNKFKKGEAVDKKKMKEKGLIKKIDIPVKVMGNGDLTKDIKITADKFSKSAIAKIKKAGGEYSIAK